LAFGATPGEPTKPWSPKGPIWEYDWEGEEPTVAVVSVGDAIVAVEDNGFQGTMAFRDRDRK
jgi:hypothetical protein